jgi:hypothetical protein
MRLVFFVAVSMALSGYAFASDPSSPIGEWRTIDDNTNEAKALVKIFESNGALYGVVENR